MQRHQHLCLVYEEYGTWLGLVTLEDVFETIIGQPVVDETDVVPNMRRFARQCWTQRLNTLSCCDPLAAG